MENTSLKTMDNNILMRNSIFSCMVCSTQTEDEALKWVRENKPAGTEHNWQKSERKGDRPVQCAGYTDRKHYLFIC